MERPKFKHGTYIHSTEKDPLKRKEELQTILDYLKSKGEKVIDGYADSDDTCIWCDSESWYTYSAPSYRNHPITFQQLKEMFEEPFDPSKPFEVSDDAMNWCKGFDYYVGCEKRLKCCYVVSDGSDLAQFKYIRNIQTQKIKRSEIISVTTSQGTFTDFVIEE